MSKEQLFEKLREIGHLKGISSLLAWDSQTMMPAGASATRGQQQRALAGIIHELETSEALGSLLAELSSDNSNLNEWEAATVRNSFRDYQVSTKVPLEVAQREAALKQEGVTAWAKAKQEGDFGVFAPILEEWLTLLRKKAAAIDASQPVYDTLLSLYERGFSSERITELFSAIKERLVPLIKAVRDSQQGPDRSKLDGMTFPTQKQEALCKQLVEIVGFDFGHGRFDTSLHPFTVGIHPTDVRMTSRYKEDDPFEAIRASIHETGHSLYEQNLPSRPEDQAGLPVSKALGMGVHESQSLFMERMVGLGQPFWRHCYPIVSKIFPQLDEVGIDATQFYQCINCVTPGLIRVSADELTYPLHIVLRWEIEVDLLEGRLAVADVPTAWNQKMEEYLGVTVPSVAEGALQDMHWAWGMLGFFPTYVLGAVYAAQFFGSAKAQIEGLNDQLAAGDLSALRQWLAENIHGQGSLPADGDALCEAVTGRPLDASVFLDYLTEKYGSLYHL